jgi:hypothetical protein
MDTFKKWTGGYENVGETHQVRRRDRAMRRSGANARAGAGGRTDGRTKAWVREIFRQHPLEIKLCRPFLARSDECRRGIETRDGKTDEEPFDMRSRIVS